MSDCPFCSGFRDFAHSITIAGQPRRLMRCRECLCCSPDILVQESALVANYEESYFCQSEWEITKSRLLADDYCTKAEGHALLRGSQPTLEIGASYGFFANAVGCLGDNFPDVLEISNGCRKFMAEHFPRLQIRGATLAGLPATPHYHGVFCFHVLEHLQSLASFLTALAARMHSGGFAFFLTPNAASKGFLRYGNEWGWSCPDQHCEFLSPFIPNSYFAAVGFDIVECYSTRPATIHTPSSLLVRINKISRRHAAIRAQPRSVRNLPTKMIGRLVDALRPQLQQNDPEARLLSVERFFHRFRDRKHHDELVLLLRRRPD